MCVSVCSQFDPDLLRSNRVDQSRRSIFFIYFVLARRLNKPTLLLKEQIKSVSL